MKQATAPVAQAVKQTSGTASHAVKTVVNAVTTVPEAVPQRSQPLPAVLPKPPAPEPEVEKVVQETVAPTVEQTGNTVAEVVPEVVSAIPDPAPVVDTVVSTVVPPSEAPAELPRIVAAPRSAALTTKATTTRSKPVVLASAPAVDDTPSVADPPMPVEAADAVTPVDDDVLDIHDRELVIAVPVVTTTMPSPRVEDWLPLPLSVIEVAPTRVIESEPFTPEVATASAPASQVEQSAPRADSEPLAAAAPQPRPLPLPVGSSSVGLSWTGTADWLTSLSTHVNGELWSRLLTVARSLRSVIVLPNLAPPG